MKKIIDILVLVFLAAILFVFSVLLYVRYLWPNASYEQIMMTLRDISPDMLDDNTVVKDYVLGCLFFVVVFPFCYLCLNLKQRFYACLVFLVSILYFSGFIYFQYYSRKTSMLYETEYVNPKDISFKFSEKKRNLLFVYVESLEQNFSMPEHYEANLIPNLFELQKEGLYSLKYSNLRGADYSMASIVASQCGIPLRFPENMNIWDAKYFLPNAVCFPEILKENGYKNIMMKAADITFTRAHIFINSHGYDEAIGKDEILKELPGEDKSKYMGTFGGVSDRVLYEFAKSKINSFDKEQPFVLSLFTLDTHVPVANLDKSCNAVFDDLRDSFICTDKALAEFIDWFKTTEHWDNTVVVIIGDHLLPSGIYTKGRPYRGIYNVFLNVADGLKFDSEKVFSTFDIAPTILEAMGVSIEPRAFGLGRSLFSQENTLVEKIGEDKLNVNLIQKSEIYKTFFKSGSERVEVYKKYKIGSVLSNDDFLEYSDAYFSILDQHYLDRLNIKLDGYNGGKLKVKLKFIISLGGNLIIKANDYGIKTLSSKEMMKQPVNLEIEIEPHMIKDNKLQLNLHNTGGIRSEVQMGISPKELIIEEIK